MQPRRPLGSGSNERQHALTEDDGGTGRIHAAKAPQLEQEANRLIAQRHIPRLAHVGAVHIGRTVSTMGTGGTRHEDKGRYQNAFNRDRHLRDSNLRNECAEERDQRHHEKQLYAFLSYSAPARAFPKHGRCGRSIFPEAQLFVG